MKHSNQSKNNKQKTARRETFIVLFFAAIVLLLIAAIIFWQDQPDESEPTAEPTTSTTAEATEPTTESLPSANRTYDIDGFTLFDSVPECDLGDGLKLLCAGRYSGEYVEDGSDEEVEGVLALVVENCGEDIIEFASIALPCGEKTVTFEVSGLYVSGRCFVLAKDRAAYEDVAAIGTPTATVTCLGDRAVLDFGGEFELHGETDRILTLRNISGLSISNVYLYYKNFRDGLLWGGITYRVPFGTVEDGTPVQKNAEHYSAAASVILYMTYDLP